MGLWRNPDQNQGDVDAFCGALLKSAELDRPSASGYGQTARRLGVPLAGAGVALGVELVARSAAAASESVALSSPAISGAVSSGVVASNSAIGAAVANGAVAGSVAAGGAVGTWGAASALLIVAKAVGVGVLVGAVGIGAVELGGHRFTNNNVPSGQSSTSFDEQRSTNEQSATPHSVRQGPGGHQLGQAPGNRTGVIPGADLVPGSELGNAPGIAGPPNANDGAQVGALGADSATHSAGSEGNADLLAGPNANGALAQVAVGRGSSSQQIEGRAAIGQQPADPQTVDPRTLEPQHGVPQKINDASGSLAMRGVGELPGASSASFPAASPLADAPSALRLELAMLNRVRSLLQRGQGSEGLRALGEYEAQFPKGTLGVEAMVLRVEALALAGRRTEARQAAQRVLDLYPRSPHIERLLQLGLLPAAQ
jgi:hypothetical protein